MNDRRLNFLSNDRVMIRPRDEQGVIELEGVPKHPRINPGTILNNPNLVDILEPEQRSELEQLSTTELWHLEEKHDGKIHACFPEQRFVLRGRMVGLVLLNWTRDGGETVARRIDLRRNTKLLPALIKRPGVFYLAGKGEAPSRDIARYLEYLDGLEVLELSGGIDFDKGRDAALELLF
jgi:HprK-related kinase B